MSARSASAPDGSLPGDRLVSLAEAARLLGVPHKTLTNKLGRGEAPELKATKIWGRWKAPLSAIQDVAQGTAGREAVAQIFDRLDYPHLRRRRGEPR